MTGDKVFLRIGDTSPTSTSTNSSAIQFLQQASATFATSTTQSAFRIRHDTVGRDLIFQSSNLAGVTHSILTLSDDGYITFNGTTLFQDIQFDEITGSYLYIGTSSRFNGTIVVTGSQKITFTGSQGTASIWYNEGALVVDGLQSGGNSWKTVYKLTSPFYAGNNYIIYTTSIAQVIQNADYLSVFLNGDLLLSWGVDPGEADYYLDNGNTQVVFQYDIPADGTYLTYVYNGGTV